MTASTKHSHSLMEGILGFKLCLCQFWDVTNISFFLKIWSFELFRNSQILKPALLVANQASAKFLQSSEIWSRLSENFNLLFKYNSGLARNRKTYQATLIKAESFLISFYCLNKTCKLGDCGKPGGFFFWIAAFLG